VNIVYTVRSESPQAPLAQLLQLPLGLDIWQVEEDHVVLRADEAQAARRASSWRSGGTDHSLTRANIATTTFRPSPGTHIMPLFTRVRGIRVLRTSC